MEYSEKKEKLISILTALKYQVLTTLSKIPSKTPAVIISLTGQKGITKTRTGYAKHTQSIDIYLVIDDSDTADVDILRKVTELETEFTKTFYDYFGEVKIYPSTINSTKPVQIAQIGVEI